MMLKLVIKLSLILLTTGLMKPGITLADNDSAPEGYEYKVLLKKEKFSNLLTGIKDFQTAIAKQQTIIQFDFVLDINPKMRIVSYLDTKKCHLKNNDYIFRKRFTFKDGIPERLKVTLKHRANNVNTVGQAFMAQPVPALIDKKFEVDLVQGPSSTQLTEKYSRSADVKLGKFKKISDLLSIYPVLKQLQDEGHPVIKKTDIKLKRVNHFVAFETVHEVGSLSIAEQSCDASFSFWYKTKDKIAPIAAEFSFVCDSKSEQATELMRSILALNTWIASDTKTKTEIAYEGFCPT